LKDLDHVTQINLIAKQLIDLIEIILQLMIIEVVMVAVIVAMEEIITAVINLLFRLPG
jgi:hypothetical protein